MVAQDYPSLDLEMVPSPDGATFVPLIGGVCCLRHPYSTVELRAMQPIRYGLLDQVADPEATVNTKKIVNDRGSGDGGGVPSNAVSMVVADAGYG